MNQIQNITSDSNQTQTINLDDGSQVVFTIYFIPMQYGWFITSLTWQDFTVEGIRITNNLNMLRQWRNIIPFGLACISNDDREPSQQQDFSSGQSNLYFLNQSDVQEYEDFINGN